jgi:hypothetical protein
MPDPSLASPNTGNYAILKGIVSFKAEGETDYRDLGNASDVTLSFDLTSLDHFSSRGGLKDKDLSIVLEKNGTLKLTLDEFTAANLALMVLGTVDEAAVGGPTIDIFTVNTIQGAFKIVGTNEIGPKMTMDLYNVSFKPSGDLGFISDEWGELSMEGDVLTATTGPNVGKRGIIQITNIPGLS